MARRVVRPSKAPYLLIAFIVLTVGCATGLAIFANLYFELRLKSAGLKRIEKAKGKYDPVQRLLNRVKKDNLIDVIEEFEKLADLHKTSIYKLSDQLGGDPHAEQSGDQLNQSVNTDVADIEGVLEEAGRALRRSLEIPGAEGKAPEMTHAKAAVLSMQTRIEELGTLLVQKETELKNRLAEIQQMSQKIKTQSTGAQKNIDRAQAELTAEQGRFREARQRLINQNTGLKDERDQVLARLEGERKTWGRERDKLGTAAETLRSQIRELSDMIAKFRVLADEVDIDGTIVDVSEEKGAAYISLAKGDAILNGMTFAVYSPEEIGKENPGPKASIRIVRIMDRVSEVRIVDSARGRPVMRGDVIANPVYDRKRKFHFAMIGGFDLNRDGLDDANDIKAKILSFGGAVDGKLIVQTDYLIVGEELPVPIRPIGSEVTPFILKDYERKREAFVEYNRALTIARDFAIPTLTVNRFLGLIGAGISK